MTVDVRISPTGIIAWHPEGHVCASEFSGLGWIHDVEINSSDPTLCARLCLIAREWLRSKGYNEYYIFCSDNSPMLEPLKRSGFSVHQIILRSPN